MTKPELDAAALDRIESGELGVGPYIGEKLLAQSRLALSQAERIAELEAERDGWRNGQAQVQELFDSLWKSNTALVAGYNALRAALAAAEAKLADERKHALVTLHALAGCVEWMGEDGCDCGSDDPRCALCEAQAVIEKCAARRAAEARS